MAATALALYVVYALLAFVLRAFVQWKRTGDTGMRFGTEATFTWAWWARLAFVAALVVGLVAPILDLAGVVEGTPSDAVGVAGVVVVVVGLVALFAVQLAMGRSWRVGVDPSERTELVVGGPFAVVRNPIFSLMILTSVGFALLVPTWVSVLAVVATVATIEVQVRAVEEPYLRGVHGAAYERYLAAVGRFVPGVGRA